MKFIIEFTDDHCHLTDSQAKAMAMLWGAPKVGKNLMHRSTRIALEKKGFLYSVEFEWPDGEKNWAYKLTKDGIDVYEMYYDMYLNNPPEPEKNADESDDDNDFSL